MSYCVSLLTAWSGAGASGLPLHPVQAPGHFELAAWQGDAVEHEVSGEAQVRKVAADTGVRVCEKAYLRGGHARRVEGLVKDEVVRLGGAALRPGAGAGSAALWFAVQATHVGYLSDSLARERQSLHRCKGS